MEKKIRLLCILLSLFGAFALWADEPIPAKGPANGTLMLLGGGILEGHANLLKKIAGGDSATVVIVPTALSDKNLSKDPQFAKIKKRFSKLNIHNVRILHTRDRNVANSASFVQPLIENNAVFFLGGRTESIIDAYKDTETENALHELLARGGIIAGVSAGSGSQAAYFSNDSLKTGFEFLEGTIVMNHFLKRNKQFDHTLDILANRNYLALGIDDNTGIVVQGDRFEVIGRSYVAIYDGTNYYRYSDSTAALAKDSERFYLLKHGDRYSLSKRTVESNKRLRPVKLKRTLIQQYIGNFRATEKDFGIEFLVENDTLKVKNSWGWKVYPILPFRKDVFFATNRNMWFKFERNQLSGKVESVAKMRSILLDDVIVTLKRVDSSEE
ncbi:MAG: cyanophycinase [Calditrichia bacterium]